jgi:4-hydroxybenzoate polyprenyltransferase
MTDSSASRWLTYLKERSPLPLLLAVAIPQALSSHWLLRTGAPSAATWASAVGIMGLLVLLRLMDEVKDEEKDRVAHPERPVPRGLLSADEVRRAISTVGVMLLVYAALLAAVFSMPMSVLLATCVVYAGLMYKEFFVSRVLAERPLIYALSHQLIVIPMYLFAVAAADPGAVTAERALGWALGGLGASFVVEVSRKLDPAANPVLRTYLHIYGRGVVAALMLGALALLADAAWKLGLHTIVWPFAVLAALTMPVLFVRPAKHAVVAGATGLAALVYMLAPAVAYFWGQR